MAVLLPAAQPDLDEHHDCHEPGIAEHCRALSTEMAIVLAITLRIVPPLLCGRVYSVACDLSGAPSIDVSYSIYLLLTNGKWR